MSATINTIIFDLSEVLISGLIGIEESMAPRLGVSSSEVLSAFGGEPLMQYCRGEISENTYLESVISKTGWSISVAELKQKIRTNFSRKVIGMEVLLERLARQYELVLLSDHGREWVQHIHELHPNLGLFHRRVYSFELGQTKQEASTFQRLLASINRRAEECAFVDDNIGNIERARSIGIHAFHFTDAKKLLHDLQAGSLLCTEPMPNPC
jgi:putative hydrolase of the HAD superfamily